MDALTLARAYDRSADGYDARFWPLQRPKYEAAVELLRERILALPDDARVLDAGAGTGLFAEWLREPTSDPARLKLRQLCETRRLVALDVSPRMLSYAKRRSLPCVCGDVARPPFPLGSFPLVLAFTSLIGDPAPGLRALGALVQDGGAMLVSLLTKDHPGGDTVATLTGTFALAQQVSAGQDQVTLLSQRGRK
ncbi:MAG: class I SAM-dependent methyltransferase [Deltaproteobacteria bacterium]|nr:class I SAM-dependent methyltransferase [Deltaproteobacteria bacterium]